MNIVWKDIIWRFVVVDVIFKIGNFFLGLICLSVKYSYFVFYNILFYYYLIGIEFYEVLENKRFKEFVKKNLMDMLIKY